MLATPLSDTVLYQPAKDGCYAHIDALFTGEIDWGLIATHQRDMIQVMPQPLPFEQAL